MFCGARINLETQRIPTNSRILDFKTLQDMKILSRGSLVADKITSLALGTVGIGADHYIEIIKQIYDIASMLRGASLADLETAYDSYPKLTGFKADCFRRSPPYAISDITDSIVESLRGLVPLDTDALIAQNLRDRHDGFRGDYLNKRVQYKKSHHATDLMLTLLFALSIQRHSMKYSRQASEPAYMRSVLESVARIEAAGADDAPRLRKEHGDRIPDGYIKRRMIRYSPPEHVYLIRELASTA